MKTCKRNNKSKTSLAGLDILLLLALACSEDRAVPIEVEHSFQKKFKLAKKAVWTSEEDHFVVDFRLFDRKRKATFDKTGRWIETRTIIPPLDTKSCIIGEAERSYPKYKIKATLLVEQDDSKTYYIKLSDASADDTDTGKVLTTAPRLNKEIELIFDGDCNLLSKG